MVKLNAEMVAKLGPGFNKRRPDETVEHYLNRLTHIYLQEKHIDGIDSIPICKNLSVVYLYDNKIEKIENFEFAPNLTHLYLHNNRIKRMENLNHLKKLTKLHLGGNCIKVVEGIENLTELVELSVENQRLPPGEKLIIDPRCLMTLMNSLRILNISSNHMDSLGELGSLVNLELLDASNNNLADMKEMSVMLKCWPRLVDLNLIGNPICAKKKYRERIIVAALNVRMLDGKEIQDLSRQFLQNWKLSKEMMHAGVASEANTQAQQRNNQRISNDPASNIGLNRHEIQKLDDMPTYIMPDIKKSQSSTLNSLKLRSARMGSGPVGPAANNFHSPERKPNNIGNFTRNGNTTSSSKSNLKSDLELNSLNGLATHGLGLNSAKIKSSLDGHEKAAEYTI